MGSRLHPVGISGLPPSMEICSWRCRTSGVPRGASRWHRRGARRGCAADSVHCRPYANPRVECPRWVGLTEGAAPSACDQNDCRKGSYPTTLDHRTAPTRSCARVRSNDSYRYVTNLTIGSVGPASTTLRPSATRHGPLPNGPTGHARKYLAERKASLFFARLPTFCPAARRLRPQRA